MPAERNFRLDGLRGVAAFVVMLAHYFAEVEHGIKALTLGWLGVSVFFVLSGYLIGSLILDSQDQPGFLRRFYFRRSVRIIPVYLITVVLTSLSLYWFRDQPWATPAFDLVFYLTFTQNFAVAFLGEGNAWLLPTWTLAVEEQFYLLLPVLMLITPRRWLLTLLIGLIAGSVVFRLGVYDANKVAALVLLPGRADLLLSGVVLALLQNRMDLSRYTMALRAIPLVALWALVIVALIDSQRLFAVANPLLLGIGVACFIAGQTLGVPEGRGLDNAVMVFLGRISYALYLFHQPINGVLHGMLLDDTPDVATLAQVLVTVMALMLSIAAAYLSWRWLENPLLTWARKRS